MKDLLFDISVTRNQRLETFCIKLRDFIIKNERIPHLPDDQDYFNDLDIDDVIYLIENCTKFTVIDNSESEIELESCSSSILDEFKYSAILAIEIQKIITRKYLPIKILNL